ncbi:AAA family ATPase [Serratia marcescens]|uniref:ATP-dependent nuclease n=1 Tax=Serratia marcescens TaxID=615 RepID=UPI001322AF28|nr:AAA family ATPase [Serratia marcescens]MXS90106.1 AAA family ATPase [Serratia marcescens]MXS98162.1 AAA family ATPase [Serratia marcescens]MXT05060.1 AAA family ATPase [Serratia marcescens]MXT08360.1 AAA family ATPase [Serratia marcescens]MXT13486.1 AAA family ATPase [Serratia marcescens]
MYISGVYLKGYRNYSDAYVKLNKATLIIGANDVGKTNLIHAIRLLLDKSFSELDLEPKNNDFHIDSSGNQSDEIEITLHFSDVEEDAVLSRLAGSVSDAGRTVIRYVAYRTTLEYKIFIGFNVKHMEEVSSRFYLKYLNMRYIKSQRDLDKYINVEKRHLLKLAQDSRTQEQIESDKGILNELDDLLVGVNNKVKAISYVTTATDELNDELKKLSYSNDRYNVQLDSGAIGTDQFIEKLELSSNANGSKVMLGGDGFNNQILLALWKTKSVREDDVENEVVIYCIEEPEAHLYPHQQRKVSSYLINDLPGQSIVTTHSPQIAVNYSPDSIVKIHSYNGSSEAASEGCSECISDAWDGMGYRMSIIPAEAFFANVVFLVEGPSEVLFYEQLANTLKIDLDFYNISIISVDGVQFDVYKKILDAFNISWVARTDNDGSKVPKKQEWQYAGINRALKLCNLASKDNQQSEITLPELITAWGDYSPIVNRHGVYLSFSDLEGDLSNEFTLEVMDYSGKDDIDSAANYLRSKKAIRMRELLKLYKQNLIKLESGDLARPLYHCERLARGEE